MNNLINQGKNKIFFCLFFFISILFSEFSFAHGVSGKDADFLQQVDGQALIIFAYLGAKHMVTGYDHLLYLFGVLFFLNRLKDVALFVSLFALGHSITLLWGVLSQTYINAYLIDSIIGLSIVYKAIENLGGIRKIFCYQLSPRVAVFCFGLIHGLGLASKLQDLVTSKNGLVANIISFNAGVEIGQIFALSLAYLFIGWLKNLDNYPNYARRSNLTMIFLGFLIAINQISLYFLSAQ